MDNKRFEVIFAAGAIKEYKKLDNSINILKRGIKLNKRLQKYCF